MVAAMRIVNKIQVKILISILFCFTNSTKYVQLM